MIEARTMEQILADVINGVARPDDDDEERAFAATMKQQVGAITDRGRTTGRIRLIVDPEARTLTRTDEGSFETDGFQRMNVVRLVGVMAADTRATIETVEPKVITLWSAVALHAVTVTAELKTIGGGIDIPSEIPELDHDLDDSPDGPAPDGRDDRDGPFIDGGKS